MAKEETVYMPRWYGWFITLVLAPIWIWMTYSAFYTEQGAQELGLVGWSVMTFMFLAIIIVIWLMAYRKLPAYFIARKGRK